MHILSSPKSILLGLLCSLTLICCGCGKKSSGGGGQVIPPPPINPNTYTYPRASAKSIRLMTYNAFYCKSNTDNKAFSEANTMNFANVIRALDPDIVMIQELDSGVLSRSKRYLLKEIKEYTGIEYQIFFGAAADYDGGKIGCGLLVRDRYPVRRTQYTPLAGDEARMLITAELDRFVVMSTHLDLNVAKRQNSVTTICNSLSAYSKPVLLGGDLNDSPSRPAAQSAFPMLLKYFVALAPSASASSTAIDYLMVDQKSAASVTKKGGQEVRRLRIDGVDLDLTPFSDHYPVYVDVELSN